MGMKAYKFLIQSRNQILDAEEKIIQIDEKLLSIEEEITDLRQEKGKLTLPKSENWKEDLDSEYESQLRKFEEYRERRSAELESIKQIIKKGEKSWNFWLWSTVLLGGIPMILIIIMEMVNEATNMKPESYFEDLWVDYVLNFCVFYFCLAGYMILMIVAKVPTSENYEGFSGRIITESAVEKEIKSLENSGKFTDEVSKKKRNYSRAVNRDQRIDTMLEDLEVEITELIQEKENLAEEIKVTWDGVSHLIPHSD